MPSIPKVSVVIPAYNVGAYLEAALQSLKLQSLQNFEALIVNDGSTDHTAKIAQRFCQTDRRFRLLEKPNGGLSSARNYGIRYAQADYIALLDGDDVYHPNKLMNHVAHLETHPNIGVVYSTSQAMRDDGTPIHFYLSGRPIHQNPLLALLCKNFVGHGSNGIFRRCLIDMVGGFDESLQSSEDVDFWMRIAALQTWQFYREPETLVYYRVRPSGLSFNVAQMQRSNEMVIEQAYQRSPTLVGPMLPKARAYLYRYLARLSLTSGATAQARSLIRQALHCDASIFWQDTRAFLTLIAVALSPAANFVLRKSLGQLQQSGSS